jgi:RIO kinase 1
MTKLSVTDILEDDEPADALPLDRAARRRSAPRKPKQQRVDILATIVERGQTARPDALHLSPTLDITSQEHGWIMQHLELFAQSHTITSVLRRVKGGKEANVYCCAAHPDTGLDLIAAKLYRPRLLRNLRNDARYREGRPMLNADGQAITSKDWRMHKAIAKKSSTGLEAIQTSWLGYEYQTMLRLHTAGVDVPRPLRRGEYALLMDYIGDAVMPAPPLSHIALSPAEAPRLFGRMLDNLEAMLAAQVVHGDLSAYNVLYWQGRLSIIDFPQVVDPHNNPDAYAIFRRDVERICQYFERWGVTSQPARLARDLWQKYIRPER